MKTVTIIIVIILIVLIFIIYHNLTAKNNNNIESFDNIIETPSPSKNIYPTPSISQTPSPPSSPSSSSSPSNNTNTIKDIKCIVPPNILQPNNKLQSCDKVAKFINNNITNYDNLVNVLSNTLANKDVEYKNIKSNYVDKIDQLIATFKRDEDNVRQQKFFITQNGNVLTINSDYKTNLEKDTSKSKETYNIQLDLFNKSKLNDTKSSENMITIKKYTKYILHLLIIILFANTLFLEFND
jgi:hypothetical protein